MLFLNPTALFFRIIKIIFAQKFKGSCFECLIKEGMLNLNKI